MYEERIVVLKAFDDDEAISLAEADAESYAKKERGEYIGFVAVYQAKECDMIFEGIQETYSIMRHDESNVSEYLAYYYDTGTERTTYAEDD